MSTHISHVEKETFYFITFTCYKWLPLIEASSLYDYFQNWINQLAKRGLLVSGFVFMPNHIHLLVYVQKDCKGLNNVIGGAKRFMAYEIVKRLKELGKVDLLQILSEGVQEEERKKGKKHQVFRLSFDARKVLGNRDVEKVLDYIHHNPVSKKWMLVEDYIDYPYSSARYYETGKQQSIKVFDYRKIDSESSKE